MNILICNFVSDYLVMSSEGNLLKMLIFETDAEQPT